MDGVDIGGLADRDLCYLTTSGRRTGNPHRIEIWFGARGGRLYLLAAKYQGWREGARLSGWARTALPVALDLRP